VLPLRIRKTRMAYELAADFRRDRHGPAPAHRVDHVLILLRFRSRLARVRIIKTRMPAAVRDAADAAMAPRYAGVPSRPDGAGFDVP